MTPSDFVAAYGGPADQAAAATGLSRWSILAQWAYETGWCASDSGCPFSNLAGITCHGGCPCNPFGFCTYSDAFAFATDYAAVLHNGLYPGVLASAGTTIRQQLAALGQSPWAGSHYDDGGGPGSALMHLYDGSLQPLSGIGEDAALGPAPGPPPPPPVTPPTAPADMAPVLLLLAAGVGAIAYAERQHPLVQRLRADGAWLLQRVGL